MRRSCNFAWITVMVLLTCSGVFAQAHKTKQRTFDALPDVLFKATLKVAKTRYVVGNIEEKERLVTFHTDQHNCTGSVEAEGADKSTLVLNMQNVLPGFTYEGRMNHEANKFFDFVQEELKKEK
jgi:hypothetical protein